MIRRHEPRTIVAALAPYRATTVPRSWWTDTHDNDRAVAAIRIREAARRRRTLRIEWSTVTVPSGRL